MSELEDIVQGFNKYHRVVVTGPQRSGTQIASLIIADILNWEQVGEQKICRKGYEHDERYFTWVNNTERQSTVLHCPRISHACHLTPKPTLVVFMMRPVAEIVASDRFRVDNYRTMSPSKMKPVQVKSVFLEKGNQYAKLFYDRATCATEDVPQRVYDVWNDIQKKEDFNWYELEYAKLEQHPLWLPIQVRRKMFQSGTQTSI